ncbi:bacteriocin biosynthesis cyclodehydratase domain-containing protein [Saccharopolyspora antimicrobica]|uniref:Bacteriocin biosynthesis cyclodehydratase domain-containing protein n=1 Tax=Saccharopolyspora antimicrobica TaxID=455193 RepID=A0A1I5GXV8_9PSEU|nr:TOMM precursor leader peptide-binding protein [Saccharopolyspora antimicrobica]RKT89254.1 bacteriocin biosynthesis cyclodehydratase domain-containing protein [Saccharopolyspora antimicrobica]SFO40842.1 bacteriocin biosynthesis cyclodehydratase domain-containing protein [Saccharopolyspora antimicrobica]
MHLTGAPRLKRSFSIIPHSPDEVELRSGVWNSLSHTIRDQSASGRLFSLINGLDGTALDDLADNAGTSRAEVDQLVAYLRDLDAIEDTPQSALDHYLDDYAHVLRPAAPPEPPPVRLLGSGDLVEQLNGMLTSSDPALAVLETAAGQQLLDDPDTSWADHPLSMRERLELLAHWRGSLLVWADTRIDPVRLDLLNRIALHLRIPWIHGVIDGPFLHVGPTFLPGATACYACFETRVLMGLTNADGYLRYKRALARAAANGGRPPLLPAVTGLLTSYLALEVINFARTGSSFTAGKSLGLHLPTWEIAVNEVLALPGCRVCAPVPQQEETSLYFDVKAWLDEQD